MREFILAFFSRCKHSNQTTPRRDDEGEYCRCLDCAERIAWAWPDDGPAGIKNVPTVTLRAPVATTELRSGIERQFDNQARWAEEIEQMWNELFAADSKTPVSERFSR